MILHGPRVTIRPMKRTDVDAMAQWRPAVDPLYQPFDFPRRSKAEHVRWFEWRNRDASRRLYTIENEEHKVIGSLTLREIDGQWSARLGITLGADFVSQGYGTEALRLFLDYYFGTMGFTQMVLDVAATNLRAVHSYLALGFRQVDYHYRPADHPSYRMIQQDPRYRHLRTYFRRQSGTIQVLFYDMLLTHEEWTAISNNRQNDERDPGVKPDEHEISG
jgi:RimJ/RimL family protein N-acetyltransferase